ncbi:hypothetical protein Pcinc_020593 [Petrolisthes cinctipes]|uniref:Uncharacterized protein n=1 Tax=Petrolisthes cinctipes TaxID=88211 RepID=A0AAE1FHU3_PETCI|nr:hypothetical protein Pcinc_020590 [Petrolisthes cinctipes]KAK3874485.1 hypothetical protein Pcinc_020593 [Petrolisthes cinctipes]
MERRISKNSPTVLLERAKLVRLWLAGASARSISQQIGVSLSVVYRWIHRWQEQGSIKTRPYNRRLRKVRWTKTHGLTTANIVHPSSAPANLPLLSQQIPLPSTSLMTLKSSVNRQPETPTKYDSPLQHDHYLKMMQQWLLQPAWFTSHPFHLAHSRRTCYNWWMNSATPF